MTLLRSPVVSLLRAELGRTRGRAGILLQLCGVQEVARGGGAHIVRVLGLGDRHVHGLGGGGRGVLATRHVVTRVKHEGALRTGLSMTRHHL